MTQIAYQFALAPQSSSLISNSTFDSTAAQQGHTTHSGQSSSLPMRAERHRSRTKPRKPLEQSRFAVAARSRRALALPQLHASSDTTEFYTNIWTAPPTTAGRRRTNVAKFIDISQVAYVLATIDFKQGYASPRAFELVNIWDPSGESFVPSSGASSWSSAEGSPRNSMSVEVGLSPRYLSNLTDISEAPDEDDDDGRSSTRTTAHFYLSNSMETPPASSTHIVGGERRQQLRHGISEEDLEHVASVPISAPLQRGDSIVFSPALAANNAVEQTWHARFLLGLHEPIRHALFVIDRFLARIEQRASPAAWNVREFFGWFTTHFVEFVKNQHDVKTKVLAPLLQLERAVQREVAACYARIFVVLAAIAAHEDAVVFSAASASVSWRDRLFTLQSDIRKLNLLVNAVLTTEELVLSPLLGRTFSASNFQRYVVPRIFRASKPKRVVIPWIVERCRVWGGDAVAQAYKDDLPFTARFLYDRMWLPYFVSHVALVMKHLDTEMTGMLAADATDASWFGGCTLQ